jgi:citrate synthase
MATRMTVNEVMSSPVLTADASETLSVVALRMTEHHVGSVVVVRDDRCVGVLTERDLLRSTAAGTSGDAAVEDWMTPEPVTLPPSATWNEASELLRDGGFRHIPIVGPEGVLLGIVSLRDLMRVAYLLAVEAAAPEGVIEAPPGLENVAVARTSVGDVQGRQGFYHYCGYNAVEIAARGQVEDAWYLMLEGELPTPEQRQEFDSRSRDARAVPRELADLLPGIARLGGSLDALRTAVSAAGQVLGCRSWLDQNEAETREQALRLAALAPVLAAHLYRLSNGWEAVEPRDDLPYAANYLYMVTGKVADRERVEAVERYLVLTVDHGFNASTFAARAIASTGADMGAALAGAVGSLSGPLHGGAPARVVAMLEEIGSPENAERWVRRALENHVRLMGFGHRVYRTVDPRAEALHEVARRFGGESLAFAETVEEVAVRLLNERRPARGLYANVEYYAGLVLEQAGLPREMFSPTFACSRMIGWATNVLEQISDNRLYRPVAHYVGPPPPRELPKWWRGPMA